MESEVYQVRKFLHRYDAYDAALSELPDEVIADAIEGAKVWIGRIRWSWTVVAANYLRDGYYHA